MLEINPVTYLLKIWVRMPDQSGLHLSQLGGRSKRSSGSSSSAPSAAAASSSGKDRLMIRIIIELVEGLLQYYYPTLIESTRRSVPCNHCLEESSVLVDPYMFSFEVC
jgi:hypothetical protein